MHVTNISLLESTFIDADASMYLEPLLSPTRVATLGSNRSLSTIVAWQLPTAGLRPPRALSLPITTTSCTRTYCTTSYGTVASGKSHLKDKIEELCEHIDLFTASTGSAKSLIYDDDWDGADMVSMGELQQPPEEMLEFLKRAHGGDKKVEIKTTQGNPSKGFETVTIERESKPYAFTYAQFDADFEFWNRLLKIPVHESESKNRAVGAMAFGNDEITLPGSDVEYGYEFPDGKERLQAHITDVYQNAPGTVYTPEEYYDRPDWSTWEILEPIFNHSRSESNRIYWMTANLVRASAMINYHERNIIQDTDEESGETFDAILVEPQDVANVVRCLDALRATTHEIDRKKRAIVNGIRQKSGPDDMIEGVEPIREYLRESDAPEVKQTELQNILEDLEDNFLIEITEGGGDKNKDVYKAFQWDELGLPRIDEHADLFTDCIDPISGEPFLESWQEIRGEIGTSAQDLMKQADSDSNVQVTGSRASGSSLSTSSDTDENGNSGLSSFGGGVNDEPELTDLEEDLLERVRPVVDGTRIRDMSDVPVEGLLGLCSLNDPDLTGVSTEDTFLDATHDVWDLPDKPDDWVSNETQARRELKNTFTGLIQKNMITFQEVHEEENGTPVDATLAVES